MGTDGNYCDWPHDFQGIKKALSLDKAGTRKFTKNSNGFTFP
jgi:hypothetical protein